MNHDPRLKDQDPPGSSRPQLRKPGPDCNPVTSAVTWLCSSTWLKPPSPPRKSTLWMEEIFFMDWVNKVEDGENILCGWRISFHDGDSSLFCPGGGLSREIIEVLYLPPFANVITRNQNVSAFLYKYFQNQLRVIIVRSHFYGVQKFPRNLCPRLKIYDWTGSFLLVSSQITWIGTQ